MQSVLIVGKDVMSHSSPTEANQCTAGNAILNEDSREDIRLIATVFAEKPLFITNHNKQCVHSYVRFRLKECLEILFAAQFLTKRRPSSRYPTMAIHITSAA